MSNDIDISVIGFQSTTKSASGEFFIREITNIPRSTI